MSEDLRRKVQEWIGLSGFALELRAAQEFRRLGLFPIASDYYKDPDTAEQREIDLVVYRTGLVERKGAEVIVVAECKRASDKPWLLLSAPRTWSPESAITQRAVTRAGQRILNALSTDVEARQSNLFSLPNLLASSLVTVSFGKGDHDPGGDRAYKAIAGVAAAAKAKLLEMEAFSPEVVVLAWPLIIIEGSLFQAWLDEANALRVEEVQTGVIAWRNPRLAFNSLVSVVTETGLPTMVAQLRNDMHMFAARAASIIEKSRG